MPSCRFLVTGLASPDLPLRILNLFAQQAIVLDAVDIVRLDDIHRIRVTGELPAERAGIILEKIRMLVLVTDAVLDQ
ncbi:hypothetical protein [Sphingomonas sp. 1P08PE]|uniref:hypothetical protein n=1 Tax=Sphingomonas sp. 1P08PE TaxID=554122 RepID=UPI0039A01786